MFHYSSTTGRFIWDIYAEIAAAKYAKEGHHPETAAKEAAMFADQMCIERAKRFPQEEKKK